MTWIMKKGQIRIAESMAVMIVFFFLVMFGYGFYINLQQHSFAQTMHERAEQNAIEASQKAYFFPELQCSTGERNVDDSCFDLLKVRGFAEKMESDADMRRFYLGVLGISSIKYYQVFPKLEDVEPNYLGSDSRYTPIPQPVPPLDFDPTTDPLFILYDQTTLAQGFSRESVEVTNMPITLYDPLSDQYLFGYLRVEYYY